MKRMTALLCAVMTSVVFAGDQFYWWPIPERVSGYTQRTFDYGDAANWSLSPDQYLNPDSRIPGESDTISCDYSHRDLGHFYYYYFGGFDLGGGSYTIGGYNAAKYGYHCTRVDLTNGTFTVKNPVRIYNQSRAYYVWNGATLIYPTTTAERAVAPGGLLEMWEIEDGGHGEIYANIAVCGTSRNLVAYLVKEGGSLIFDPAGLNTTSSNYGDLGVVFENQGLMSIPHGINWSGMSWNNEPVVYDRMRFRQTSGTMLLGGDVRKTALNHTLPGELTFELKGGVLEVTNSVSFYTAEAAKNAEKDWGDQVFAEMPTNAAATVDVKTNSTFDMTIFTYGTGAALTKTGPGKVILGANRPATLAVQQGQVVFGTAFADLSGVTFANGTTVGFGAPGNTAVSIANATHLTFTLGEGFQAGSTVLTTDAATAAAVAANLQIPAYLGDCEAEAQGGDVVLKADLKVTITPKNFSVPVGTAANAIGFNIAGLQAGDTYADCFSGAPVYDFGGYTTESTAGTYEITLSGITSEKYTIIFAKGTLTAVDSSTATTFYWKFPISFAHYDDVSNWALSADFATPATRLPCALDKLWGNGVQHSGDNYWTACFNMNGYDFTLGGYDAGTGVVNNWKRTRVEVTNGVLRVADPSFGTTRQSHAYTVHTGGTLIYPYSEASVMMAPSGLTETWTIKNGGRGEIYNAIAIHNANPGLCTYLVETGGMLIFAPYSMQVNEYYNEYGLTFENHGTFHAPYGFIWMGDSNSSSVRDTNALTLRQIAGTMLLGGDFKKTGKCRAVPGVMTFELVGGTLEITNSVAFFTPESAYVPAKGWYEQVYGVMPAAASATVQVDGASSADMAIFTFGAGAALTKTGPGLLRLAARPATLDVQAGSIEFSAALADLEGVTLADDVKVIFGASGNALSSIPNAANVTYGLADTFPVGGTILVSSDAALLQTVLAQLSVPQALDATPAVVNGKIVLRPNAPVVITPHPRTLLVGSEPSGNGYSISGPEGVTEFITGEPVYAFGGYTASSGAGIYDITLSGLASDSCELVFATNALTAVTADDARTFYWKGGKTFLDYWNTNNWSYASDYSDTAQRLPCKIDRIWAKTYADGSYYYNGCYDLGGGIYEIDSINGTGAVAWRQFYFGLTNGTFAIHEPRDARAGIQQAPRYEIFAGATLVYPDVIGNFTSFSPSGLQERWIIHAGGRGEIYNRQCFCSTGADLPFCEIEAGGTLIFAPQGFGTSANNYGARGARLVNCGTMLAPNGIDWSNPSYSSDPTTPDSIDRVRFTQAAGVMLLGGDVKKTQRNFYFPGQMVFELAGGTLEITNSVSFFTADAAKNAEKGWGEQVFAEMPEGAAATLDVKVDSVIDMTPFSYSNNTTLVKTGPGNVIFGADLPASLVVNGGTVIFCDPVTTTTPSEITIGYSFVGTFPLRIWKNGAGDLVNDVIDFGDGLEGVFTIKPTAHGFGFEPHALVRVGSYASDRELPAASFAARDWKFCRVDGDADSLYMRLVPEGTALFLR